MIYRLQVELIAGMYMPERNVTRTLDVAGSCNLEKLCIDILNSIDFDFDHMYELLFSRLNESSIFTLNEAA